jgi:iron-sulfur cluster repair protein YtfE (RIC family)
MGLSIVAMLIASTGVLPPVAGAMIQEAIDVIVILNALRALTGGMEKVPSIPGWTDLSARLRREHRDLAPSLARIRPLADRLGTMPPDEAHVELQRMRTFLVETLIPHEEAEDRDVFPMLAQAVGNDDVTAALHRTHSEIFHLIRFTDRLVSEVPPEGPGPEELTDLRRVLYGLDAILRLHMAQEEELYLALGDEHPETAEPILQRA